MGNATPSVCICITICFLIFASPIVILITLNYVGLEPKFYIQNLNIPSLNSSYTYNASNLNTSIIIDIKFKRVVALVPIRYQNVNITLYYASNTSFPVAHLVIPGFSQGKKKTVRRRAVVEAAALPWEDAPRNISGGSTVALGVELATRYQLKRCGEDDCYYTKGKVVVVKADVVVGSSGLKLSKKAIKLH